MGGHRKDYKEIGDEDDRKPWIASTGNLFKTICLRTGKENFENWKLNTFNWQESGVRTVTFSRLCRWAPPIVFIHLLKPIIDGVWNKTYNSIAILCDVFDIYEKCHRQPPQYE